LDEQTAKLVIAAGAAVGVVVWLFAVRLYRKMADAPAVEHLEAFVGGPHPEDAMKTVSLHFARYGGSLQLERPTPTKLTIDQTGVGIAMTITTARSGGRTLLSADIDDQALRRRMLFYLALFVLVVMPITIVGLAAGLWHFVAASPSEHIRWQSLQIAQMVHALWPPFAIYAAWKRMRAAAVNAVSNLLVVTEAA
jgi:hypothetical protein